MRSSRYYFIGAVILAASLGIMISSEWGAQGQERPAQPPIKNSYDQISPTLIGKDTFEAVMVRDKADKPGVMARQQRLLEERYDLTSRPDKKVTMTRGKPIQVGPAARLSAGMTWEKLSLMSSDQIRDGGLLPKAFLPLPHPKHDVGGMVFPQMQLKQFERLERFDVDFDL